MPHVIELQLKFGVEEFDELSEYDRSSLSYGLVL